MRPADHPEFFRFPAPPGRSRESSIVLDRNGRFWHDGEPIEHAGMARAFAGWVARHPDDGRFILTNGYDWTYFTVEDVPFFVRSVKVHDAEPWLELNDGSEEPLDAARLEVGEGEALYTQVRGATFRAKFTPAAQTELAPWLVAGENGAICLQIGNRRTDIPSTSLRS